MKEDADEWGMVPDGCMVKTTVFKGTRWEAEIAIDREVWDSSNNEEKRQLFQEMLEVCFGDMGEKRR